MQFEKWQALGNDYLILEAAQLPWELTPARIQRLCEPHFGVGSDGVLLLSRSEDPDLVAELRIFNPDGSEAELSGNGAREAILYLRRHGWTDADTFSIGTAAGRITPTIASERTCSVEMGRASTVSKDFPSGGDDGTGTLSAGGRNWAFQHVSIGNPQCAIEVGDEVEELDLAAIGPEIEGHRAVPEPHQRLVPEDRRQPGAGADLRARSGGDALLGDGRLRRRRDRLPARRREPDRGRARWRRARGRDLRRARTCGSAAGPSRSARASCRRSC